MPYAGQVAGTLGRAARKLPILSASRRRRRGAGMIRTGDDYRAGLRDGREIWIDGERVADVTAHPAFKPIVDAKARMYDLAHDAVAAPAMTFAERGERFSILLRPTSEKEHRHEKWRAVDLYLNDIGGVVTRVGDETVGEMWSL